SHERSLPPLRCANAAIALCAGHRGHRVLEIPLGRAAGADREDNRMVDAGGAEARDEIAAVLRRAERSDTAHVGVAQRLVGLVAFALAPEPAHLGELAAKAVAVEHLVVLIDKGIAGEFALE